METGVKGSKLEEEWCFLVEFCRGSILWGSRGRPAELVQAGSGPRSSSSPQHIRAGSTRSRQKVELGAPISGQNPHDRVVVSCFTARCMHVGFRSEGSLQQFDRGVRLWPARGFLTRPMLGRFRPIWALVGHVRRDLDSTSGASADIGPRRARADGGALSMRGGGKMPRRGRAPGRAGGSAEGRSASAEARGRLPISVSARAPPPLPLPPCRSLCLWTIYAPPHRALPLGGGIRSPCAGFALGSEFGPRVCLEGLRWAESEDSAPAARCSLSKTALVDCAVLLGRRRCSVVLLGRDPRGCG